MPFFGSLAGFSVRIVSGPPVVNPLTNDGSNDVLVVKYDSSGTPLWTRRMGGTGEDLAISVSTDSSGNVIVAGYYASSSLNIYASNGTTVSFTLANNVENAGTNDAFVVKYNSSGTPLWARRMGGTNNDQANSVSTDLSGNIVVTGQYGFQPLNIYAANGSTVSFTLTNSGNEDVFVVKYDSSGTPLWVRKMGGTGSDFARSVSVDSSGNIIVTGSYGSATLNIFAANGSTVSFTLARVGSSDTFVVKYDPNGTPLWARRIGGTASDEARSVSTDSSGNIVVTGIHDSNPLNIYAADGTTVSFTLANAGFNDVFVVKYDSSGTPQWARRMSTINTDQPSSVSTDSSGNVIVAGYYTSNTLNIFAANGSTVSLTLTNSGTNDAFVVKYDSSGTPQWARRLAGTASDVARSVSTDSSGNIVVAGSYISNPLNIYAANGTTVSFTLANTGGQDAFVVKYDSSGTPFWARRMTGAGFDAAYSVSTDSSGNIVVAGYYTSNPLVIS
jgi:plastocyanin